MAGHPVQDGVADEDVDRAAGCQSRTSPAANSTRPGTAWAAAAASIVADESTPVTGARRPALGQRRRQRALAAAQIDHRAGRLRVHAGHEFEERPGPFAGEPQVARRGPRPRPARRPRALARVRFPVIAPTLASAPPTPARSPAARPGGNLPESSEPPGTVRPPGGRSAPRPDPGSPDSVRPDATGAAARGAGGGAAGGADRPPADGLPSAGPRCPRMRSAGVHGRPLPARRRPRPQRSRWCPADMTARSAWSRSSARCCGCRDFRKLWLSMSLSSFGDWLGLLAITATATSLVDGFAAANFALGGVLLFRLLPAIVLGPLAGAFADRFDRRKTMVVADVIRFALFASIPLVDNLIWLFVAQFLIEAFTLFWIPAKEAAVPNMLRKDQLEPANQLSLVTTYGLTPVLASIVFAILTTVGGRVSGVIPGVDQVDLALYLNALTFLVAAVVIWNLRRSAAGAPTVRRSPPRPSSAP